MAQVTLAEAKARLSELVERAAKGESVRITRRGKLVAQITAMATPRKRIDAEALRQTTSSMPRQERGAGEWMRTIRDEDRY